MSARHLELRDFSMKGSSEWDVDPCPSLHSRGSCCWPRAGVTIPRAAANTTTTLSNTHLQVEDPGRAGLAR